MGIKALKEMIFAWEKEELLTPKLYADPHRFIFKFLTQIEKKFTRWKLNDWKPIEIVHHPL